MRQLYETIETLQAERDFSRRYSTVFHGYCEKLPARYRVDCAVMRSGRIVEWLELKCRSHAINQHPGYWLSLSKFLYGCSLAERTGVAFVLAVRFLDADARVTCSALRRDQWEIVFGGRSDRGDPEDREPLVNIPINLFECF
jgi:hypothetical protein